MIKANLHTHSLYCDGKAGIEEVITTAIEKGFDVLGFSSHAPVPFDNNFSIKNEAALKDYVQEVRELSKKYADDIKVYLSLEADYIPGISKPFAGFRKENNLDYIIGSVHLVKSPDDELWFIDGPKHEIYDEGLKLFFKGDIATAVKAYYHQVNEMITTQKPDMVGHLDKVKMHNKGRYFEEDESWYVKLVDETLDYLKANNIVMEVNTRGIYRGRSKSLFPGKEILKKAAKLNIPVSLNSDAHKPQELEGYYAEAKDILIECGYKEVYYYLDGFWKSFAINKRR
ncbi:MAG TPA: histidinol-phosphatase [Bacteroidales bacterium]|nr:histidinol-phosphatase [Bacteroidales bacterium]